MNVKKKNFNPIYYEMFIILQLIINTSIIDFSICIKTHRIHSIFKLDM